MPHSGSEDDKVICTYNVCDGVNGDYGGHGDSHKQCYSNTTLRIWDIQIEEQYI